MRFCHRQFLRRGVAVFYLLPLVLLPARAQQAPVDPDADASGNHVQAREQWFLRGRRSAHGEPPALMRARALAQRARMLTPRGAAQNFPNRQSVPFSMGSGAAWKLLGPLPLVSDPTGGQSYGNVAGRVTAIAVDQNDASGNTVYVGAAYGGVWKSKNAAAANPANVLWQPLTDDQITLSIGALAVSPDGNTVLVGTGEPNNAGDSYYGEGILRSTSAGAPGSWQTIAGADSGAESFVSLGFSKIAFNTSNPAQVVAAVAHAAVTEGSTQGSSIVGLYFSGDGGATWSLARVFDGGTQVIPGSVTDVVFNPSNNTFYAAYRAHGIYQSSDGGHTWSRLPNQPDPSVLTAANCPSTQANLSGCPLYRAALAFNPASGELFTFVIGIMASGSDVDHGVWETADAGATAWGQLDDTPITSCGDQQGCGVNQGTYDLYLSVIPDGGSRDLYAGLVNLYKTSAGGSFNNLTHVYGCNPLHMHPDYHAQDFSRGNPAIIYFGNDGGVYRTLNGFGTPGGCFPPANTIDSLNNNLGSLTQFMSFSQHATNPNVILGGTQDNGSPATASAESSSTWAEANLGDGGFNAIAPDGSFWLTARTDVSIERCTPGGGNPGCVIGNFTPLVNVEPGNGAVNFPDHGDFYTPYILDPANQGQVIIGTCRVWRGSSTSFANWSSGSFANALSNKLDQNNTGANSACASFSATTPEAFYVRSLAAGGPATGAGSQVIYAGMAGGLDSRGNPIGGNLWVTTNAAGGAGAWVDRTGSINPNHFDVSSIAVDPGDPSGQTAYVTVMGFMGPSGGHVFKTTNAGLSWSDVSANLPDAPADSAVVDPTSPSDLLLATDVGVFRSTNGGASWSALGKAFPNVVVNRLLVFNSGGGGELLRASTHGRGILEINLSDFALNLFSPLLVTFPSQNASFSGSMSALAGYSGAVTLSCQGGAVPDVACTPSPASVTAGQAFNLTVAGSKPQDYGFNIHGAGNDPAGLTHDQPVTLRVIDFALSAPGALPAAFPNFPVSANFTVSGLGAPGAFNQPVSLSCGSLPPGVTCSFSPPSPQPVSGGPPVPVTVTVSPAASAVGGNYTLQILASTSGDATVKGVNLPLTLEDFSLGLAPASQSVFPAGSPATFNGSLAPIAGYNKSVSLACAAPPNATCMLSAPSAFVPPGSFSITTSPPASASPPLDMVFTVSGAGSDPGSDRRQQSVTLHLVDVQLSALSPAGISMPPSSISQPVNFQIVPVGAFNAAVTLACSGLPTGASCQFNGLAAPAMISASGSPRPVALTITTSSSTPSGAVSPSPVITATTPGKPGMLSATLPLTITSPGGATDMGVTLAAESASMVHAVGQPLTLSFTVTNSGAAVVSANLYVNFAAPVLVQSLDPACRAGSSGAGATTAAITCAIGSMSASASQPIAITVVPGFTRTLSASAVVNSELEDSNLANNTAASSRNIRPRPFARRGLPAIVP